MKLSTRARYALRMMVEISRQADEEDHFTCLTDVAEKTRISRRYLEQIAISLRSKSLIRGKKGKTGGYCLTRSPGRITVGQIFEAVIGQVNIVDCVLERRACYRADWCECRSVYCAINNNIETVLNHLTLENLLERNA